MKILVIGGTVFLGRHFTEAALAAGHEITLFNRGRHNPELFPDAEKIQGDRASDVDRLTGRWDAVLDTSGYFPRDVEASAQAVSDRCDRYIFISSLSVFADGFTTPGIREDGKLLTADPSDTEITGENYGGLKALCEQAAEAAMPGRALIVRPGLIVGPHDQSDRFTYWPMRLARGGDILAPGPEEEPIQTIDVRDLANWILELIEAKATGVFNATGPDYELSMGHALGTGLVATGGDGTLIWVDPTWLSEQDVKPWTALPLWIPGAPGFARFDCSKAFQAGLKFRPLEETFRDTLEWASTRDDTYEWKGGLTQDREAQLLKAWAVRNPDS